MIKSTHPAFVPGNKGPVKIVTSESLFSRPPFRLGFLGAKKGVYEPDAFYSGTQDQIDYERGFHFHAVLKSQGVKIHSIPIKPTRELKNILARAVIAKEIL